MSHISTDSFPSADYIKNRLSHLTAAELKALEDISRERARKNWLRSNGWLNIFLGGLTLWLGLSGLSEPALPRLIQTIAGAIIVGQSVWAIVSPSKTAILRFAVVLLGAGIWNIFLAVSDGAWLTGLLGIAQLWWALQAYRGYKNQQVMNLAEPQDDLSQFYDEVYHAITKGVLKRDADSIDLWIGLAKWRGLLLDDKVVFVPIGSKLLSVQHKDEFNFVPNSSNAMNQRRVYGRIKDNTGSQRALIKRDSFARYARWKGEEAVLAQVSTSLWGRFIQAVQIIILLIVGLLVLYTGYILIRLG
jgi:hypothetical protein